METARRCMSLSIRWMCCGLLSGSGVLDLRLDRLLLSFVSVVVVVVESISSSLFLDRRENRLRKGLLRWDGVSSLSVVVVVVVKVLGGEERTREGM